MAAPEGIVWGDKVGDYCRIGIYTAQEITETEITVTVEVWFWSKYSVTDKGGNNLYLDNLSAPGEATTDKGGTNIETTYDSGSGWSTKNQVLLTGTSYTYKHTRTTSDVTRYIHAKLTGINKVSGEALYASTTVTIPALDITACSAPTSFTTSPAVFDEDVTLAWAGATGGVRNSITGYEIQFSTSADGSAWSSWVALGVFDGSPIVDTPSIDRGQYEKYRIRTQGAAGSSYYSGWMESNIVHKDNEPYVYIPNADLNHERHLSYIYDEMIDPEQPFGKYMPYVFDGASWQRHS